MKSTKKDYYRVLQVPRNASLEDIKRAYRRLARKFHPDVNPNNRQAEERLKEINEAYAVLSDPEARQRYDRERTRIPIRRDTSRRRTRPHTSRTFQDLFDIFMGESATSRSPHVEVERPRGRTYEAHVTLEFEETFSGKEVTLSIEGRRVRVHIPAGVRDGMTLRVSGAGGRSVYGGLPGDLLLRIHVRPHPHYRLEGEDLIVNASVDLFTALLGGEIVVRTPDGLQRVAVPPGTQPGSTLRVPGRGHPLFEHPGKRGDLLVHVQLELPRRMSKEEQALVRQWQQIRHNQDVTHPSPEVEQETRSDTT